MIAEERHAPGWKVELLGRPGAFYWKRKFFGPQEQDVLGEHIARVLATVICGDADLPIWFLQLLDHNHEVVGFRFLSDPN
jgi:hypothetical protein